MEGRDAGKQEDEEEDGEGRGGRGRVRRQMRTATAKRIGSDDNSRNGSRNQKNGSQGAAEHKKTARGHAPALAIRPL